jgi:Rad3-related DNA helicase
MHKKIETSDWRAYFPFNKLRPQQEAAINFVLNTFLTGQKKFCIVEAGTGIGKSAIAITVSRYMNSLLGMGPDVSTGSYVLTTQKILQDQYKNDFGFLRSELKSIKSSTNYTCAYNGAQTCAESRRILAAHKEQLKDTDYFKACSKNCVYSCDKAEFKASPIGVTNIPYFLAETTYAGKLEPRELLICDEAHNLESELGKFVEIVFTEKFANDVLNIKPPKEKSQEKIHEWIKKKYRPAALKAFKAIEAVIGKDVTAAGTFAPELAKKYEMLDKHLCKVERFIQTYTAENWIMNVSETLSGKKQMMRYEFKPVDVSVFASDSLFKFGRHALLMSATIINKDAYCRSLGLQDSDVDFISLDSPFPLDNRLIHYVPIGKMSMDSMDKTLPNIGKAIQELLDAHPNDKGIIHAVSFKVANYIKENVRSSRLLIQDDKNRDAILKFHNESPEPTVLVSPSMTEGVDLKDDLSRFQIFAKVPFPFLGDQVVKRRATKDENWYAFSTIRTMVQAVGRSIRNETDWASTYILDESFGFFYRKNQHLFPEYIKKAIIM